MCQGLRVCVLVARKSFSVCYAFISISNLRCWNSNSHTHTNIVHFDIGIHSNLAEVYDVFFRLYIDVGNSHSMDHQSDK